MKNSSNIEQAIKDFDAAGSLDFSNEEKRKLYNGLTNLALAIGRMERQIDYIEEKLKSQEEPRPVVDLSNQPSN